MGNTVTVQAEMPKEVLEVVLRIPEQLNALKREIENLHIQKTAEHELPVPGESRYSDIAHRLGGMDRKTWDRLVSAGKAPPRIKRGGHITVYGNAELIRYFKEKENYRAPSE